MKKVVWTTQLGWAITLTQTGKDKFAVTYGKEFSKGDYELASRKLGEAIMHALTCEGRIDV